MELKSTKPSRDIIRKLHEQYAKSSDQSQKEKIKSTLFKNYFPLVKKISSGLARRQTDPIEDIIQVGCMGLLKAIDQFDINAGAVFKTYATYLITGEIRHYLRDKSSMIKAPREIHELAFRVNLIEKDLTDKFNRPPTNLEIAEVIQMPVKRVEEATQVNRRKNIVSLDQVVSVGTNTEQFLVDMIVDNKYHEYMLAQEDKIMLNEAIEQLDKNIQDVIKLTYYNDLNQTEIAKKLGISQMQVSRTLKKGIEQLFNIISSKKNLTRPEECNDELNRS